MAEGLTRLTRATLLLHSDARSATARGLHGDAAEMLQRLCVLQPKSAAVWCELSAALRAVGQPDAAYDAALRAVGLEPNNAMARGVLGSAMQTLARFEQAEEQHRQALSLDPSNVVTAINLGALLIQMGRACEAVIHLDALIRRCPDSADARYMRAMALLTLGQWERAWPDHEQRFKASAFRHIPVPPLPRWDGMAKKGARLLLNSEQGLGDTIHFARYIPLIAQLGLTVVMGCPPEIGEIVASVGGISQMITRAQPPPQLDLWTATASLPMLFHSTIDHVPNRVPYLHAEALRIEHWRRRLASLLGSDQGKAPLKIGIVWTGSPRHQNDRARSCKLEHFFPLARIAGVRMFSLQKGAAADALASAPPDVRITPLGDELRDFSDTAAVLEVLDLLISVDTAVVHMAGALARPVWNLLAYGADWRWLVERRDTPWYPTMRLFRQPTLHDWVSVFVDVERGLRRRSA